MSELKPGTRVKVTLHHNLLRLQDSRGTILGPDIWEGFYRIKLDRPAIYVEDGSYVWEIMESEDSMEIIGNE